MASFLENAIQALMRSGGGRAAGRTMRAALDALGLEAPDTAELLEAAGVKAGGRVRDQGAALNLAQLADLAGVSTGTTILRGGGFRARGNRGTPGTRGTQARTEGAGGRPPTPPPGAGTAEAPIGPYQPTPRQREDWTPWTGNSELTPQSSNVYSFGYDHGTSTLYVTYKAHELGEGVEGHTRKSGRRQLVGEPGHTVTGRRTNAPGPMYAYLDVPERVFLRMKLANSKGKFVWDELRQRGTVYGHQYRYVLVHGMLTQHEGHAAAYVPRRATPRGFRVRSEVQPGTGRRAFVHSALPSQEGFSTRRKR